MLNSIFDLIDTRSFPSLWYWIAIALCWTMATQRILGVPYDMVKRARRLGGQAAEDLVAMTRLCTARLLRFGRRTGVAATVTVSCLLTLLVVLGFGYDFEFLQAVALLAVPLAGVSLMGLRTAGRIEAMLAQGADAGAVAQTLLLHRFFVQLIAIGAILITTFWGMAHNLRPFL